jgi:acetate kinase
MDKILNKQSGFLGVSGISNDLRNVRKAAEKGNQRAKLAIEIFINRLKEYIGAYLFCLGKVDAVCLTGGIGENNPGLLKPIKNQIKKISHKTKVLTVPTDEELMIAKLTYQLFVKNKRGK